MQSTKKKIDDRFELIVEKNTEDQQSQTMALWKRSANMASPYLFIYLIFLR